MSGQRAPECSPARTADALGFPRFGETSTPTWDWVLDQAVGRYWRVRADVRRVAAVAS